MNQTIEQYIYDLIDKETDIEYDDNGKPSILWYTSGEVIKWTQTSESAKWVLDQMGDEIVTVNHRGLMVTADIKSIFIDLQTEMMTLFIQLLSVEWE